MFLFLKFEQTERTKLASVYEDKSYFFHNNTRRTLGHKMWFYSAAIKEYYFYREECTVYRTVYQTKQYITIHLGPLFAMFINNCNSLRKQNFLLF